MVLSVLEASVPPSRWDELKASFRRATEMLPPQICEILLIQSVEDPERWKVVIVWHVKQNNRQVEDSIRDSGAAGIFRSIGIEPSQGLFNIMLNARESDLGSDLADTPLTDMLAFIQAPSIRV